jgi:hypothetical protein
VLFLIPASATNPLVEATVTIDNHENTPVVASTQARIKANADYVKFVAGTESLPVMLAAVQTPGTIVIA